MYRNFFGLRANPFGVNPDPRFLCMTPHTQEALACLIHGIQSRRGFVLLTGEVGTGKTTLLNKVLDWLHQRHLPTAFIFNSRLNVTQFFDFMLTDFGIPCESLMKSQVLIRMNHWLLDRYRSGETAVLIVDEAQNLSPQVLEEIRLLTNLETSREKLLQIILCGQSELELKLKHPALRQLRQRVTLQCRTYPLTLAETEQYIAQRLKIAGSDGRTIFTPEAVQVAHQYSCGIPRVINTLCEHALIGAYVDQQRSISPERIEEVAREFQLDEVEPIVDPTHPAGTLEDLFESEQRARGLGTTQGKGAYESNS